MSGLDDFNKGKDMPKQQGDSNPEEKAEPQQQESEFRQMLEALGANSGGVNRQRQEELDAAKHKKYTDAKE